MKLSDRLRRWTSLHEEHAKEDLCNVCACMWYAADELDCLEKEVKGLQKVNTDKDNEIKRLKRRIHELALDKIVGWH